jgi:hypothetical protein
MIDRTMPRREAGFRRLHAGLFVLAAVTAGAAGLKAVGVLPIRHPPSPLDIAARDLPFLGPVSGSGTVPPSFTESARAAGIDFIHDNDMHGEYRLPEQIGPGAGVLDFDGDGDLDLFLTGGGALDGHGAGQRCRLYRNDGGSFSDSSAAAGADVPGPAFGVACADYDDDGDEDLFVTRLGPSVLLRNDGGRFVDATDESGLRHDGFGASAAFLDADRDGRLDLFVVSYVDWSPHREHTCRSITGLKDYCSPLVYEAPSAARYFRNLGGGRFEDASGPAGIAARRGNGLGVAAADFDGDGWTDVYVANDQTPAFLWHNRGDGTFEEIAESAGCAYDGRGTAISGMGVACEDIDGDGDFDLFVTNIRDQLHLVLENRLGSFADVSLRMGLAAWNLPRTGFGVVLFDQDHDGALDAFIANGAVNMGADSPGLENPYAEPSQFARLAAGRFVDASAGSGADFRDVARAAAAADFDGDGDLDLLITSNGGPARLLRNENRSGNAWLMVDVRTGPGDRAAIGAVVEVSVGGRTWVRAVRPQSSYLTSGDPRAHFGLGAARGADRVSVTWPDGATLVLDGVAANQVLRLHRDQAAAGDAP